MENSTVENILAQINQLPAAARAQLLRTLEQEPLQFVNGSPTQQEQQPLSTKEQLDKQGSSKPLPDSTREMKWIAEHKHEYAGQWVALDGDRLIAHGPNAHEVYAAANADGAYLPMVTFIPDPAKPSSILWA